MMGVTRVLVTEHAVARYIERIRPGLAEDSALRELAAMLSGSHPVKELEPGLWLWRGPKPRRLRLRVDVRDPEQPRLVTVLTAHDGMRRHLERT